MIINFDKYQGTGNDFIIINGIKQPHALQLHTDQIAKLCDRRFGIGADGLMILTDDEETDFTMTYYNANGHESTMCGNGGRCISAFARQEGVCDIQARFQAIDGVHEVRITDDNMVELEMKDVTAIDRDGDAYILDTGSPHYVIIVEDYAAMDIVDYGKSIRYAERYLPDGINVNIASLIGDRLYVKTYERGVENETYSCGTGVTASALAASLHYAHLSRASELSIVSKGGDLKVKFNPATLGSFSQIWLCGPASKVFTGKISLV